MKRLLVLVVALPLAAVLLIPTSGSAQSTLEEIVQANPRQLTISTTPRRDRTRPYTFTTTGRLIPPVNYCAPGQNATSQRPCIPILCPPGTTDIRYCLLPGRRVICAGNVTVRYQKNTTTISSRIVDLRPDCTYRSKVSFSLLSPQRRGNLHVRARFGGNAVLLPRASRTITVRAG